MRKEIYLRSGKTLAGKFHKVPGSQGCPWFWGAAGARPPEKKEAQLTWEEGPVPQCTSQA